MFLSRHKTVNKFCWFSKKIDCVQLLAAVKGFLVNYEHIDLGSPQATKLCDFYEKTVPGPRGPTKGHTTKR